MTDNTTRGAAQDRQGKTPLILEIKGNSLDDGPGIRTVVFFKGCPLDCLWCHNPESKKIEQEISFDPTACVGCDSCLAVCARHALDRTKPGFVDRTRCDLCLACVDGCPAEALAAVGRRMEIDQIVALVKKDIPFFNTSGGGVTLSGGEPTFFMEYCGRLLSAFQELGIHTLVETCGLFNCERFLALVYPFTDAIYFDLKLYDSADHRRLCGAGNETILKNFATLQELCAQDGKELLARIPLIPEMTTSEQNLRSLASFLTRCGARKVALLPYHPLWIEKNAKIGRDIPPACRGLVSWMKPSELKRYEGFLAGLEII
ncbi:MAG: glycyl-radical enzyme activating protein [Smithellaceae bacterium]|nr:glycyl-radical enzyme activating protein [Smithellaceae bacterium]